MANQPGGAGLLPGVTTDVITQSRGVSIPGGSRVAAMIGEGSTDGSRRIGGFRKQHVLFSDAGLDSQRTKTYGSSSRRSIAKP